MATPGKRAGGGAEEATARCGDSARTRRRLGSIWTRNSGGTKGGRTEEAAVGREGGKTARKLARRGSGACSAACRGGLYANEARSGLAWAPPLRPRLYANNAENLSDVGLALWDSPIGFSDFKGEGLGLGVGL